jgi:hypothetical protein
VKINNTDTPTFTFKTSICVHCTISGYSCVYTRYGPDGVHLSIGVPVPMYEVMRERRGIHDLKAPQMLGFIVGR